MGKLFGKKKENPYGKTLAEMEKKIEQAYQKLQKDLNQKAPLEVIQKDNNELLMLLGECNYLIQECEELAKKPKRRKSA